MNEKKTLKFFLVDDDGDIIDLMTVLLEAAGHTVASEMVGAFAISRIAREKPDCLLLDLMMAQLDGIELCRELRGRPETAGLRIVFVSARTEAMWRERARDAGADGYVTKPLNPETFVTEIEQILEGATT